VDTGALLAAVGAGAAGVKVAEAAVHFLLLLGWYPVAAKGASG